MNQWKNFTKGFFKENPVFVLFLGMCPTLGVTTSAINGLGMGLSNNICFSNVKYCSFSCKKFIPDKVRIPAFIVIIASFVTIVELQCKLMYLHYLNSIRIIYSSYCCKLYCIRKS